MTGSVVINAETVFLKDREAWPGVVKAAQNVRRDVELVTGKMPGEETAAEGIYDNAVIYGTVGRSPLLERTGKVHLDSVRGKWEVYAFCVVGDSFDRPT